MAITQYLQQGKDYKFSGPFNKLNVLPAGVYSAQRDHFGGLFLSETRIQTDNLIQLPGSPALDINTKVDDFLDPSVAAAFERYDMVYKRGILLYGPPGTGKTSVINIVIRTAIEKNMVVLLNANPYDIGEAVENIREIEQNHDSKSRPVLVVWEEFERYIERCEGDLLDLLDGVDQIDNTFYIATTNYIEMIPARIKNRPSRFAEVIEIGAPNADLRKAYIEAKLHPEDDIDVKEWVVKTEGFVLDQIKDLIISVLVLKIPLDEAVRKLQIMQLETDAENKNLLFDLNHPDEEPEKTGYVGLAAPAPINLGKYEER